MTKKHLLFILVGSIMIFLVAACGGAAQPNAAAAPPPVSEQVSQTNDGLINLRFTIWSGNEAHLAMLNGFAEAFRQTHPNVTVQFDTIPPGDYTDKLVIQLAGSNPPDAGWVQGDSAPAFISAGVLADLGPALRQDLDYDFADLSASAMEPWQQGEAVYSIPFSTSPFLILYNRDLFEAAEAETPAEMIAKDEWTWEALAETAKLIADGTLPGIYGFESLDAAVYSTRFWNNLVPIMRAYGGDSWNAEGTICLLNSPESVAAIQLYHDMVFVDGSAVPPGEQGDFYSGQSAMTMAQLSRVARLKDAPFQWGVAPLPSGPVGQRPVIGQAAISVFNAGPNNDIAIEFVTFMTNKENVTRMAEFFPPARNSVLESKEFLEANPLVDPESMQLAVVSAIQNGTVLSSHAEFPNIDLIARVQLESLWVPSADVEAVMTDLCTTLDPFLGG
jgi:multiple sugar transport system substrate-binding protein